MKADKSFFNELREEVKNNNTSSTDRLKEQIESEVRNMFHSDQTPEKIIQTLKDRIHELEGIVQNLQNEISQLKHAPVATQVEHVLSIDDICQYSRSLTRDEIKTIQNMLFSLMETIDGETKKKITSIKPEPTPTNITMGDVVTNKYVQK